MTPRFFVGARIEPSACMALPDAVAHHATRVLRLAAGDPLVLFDGSGGQWEATLIEAGRHGASVRVDRFDPIERESPLKVVLVQSVLAADAMDYAVRKAIELGVFAIQPVVAARSQFALAGAKADKRLAHWRAIAIAACEQCGRNRVPEVAAPQALEEWLQVERTGLAVIAGPGTATSLAAIAAKTLPAAVVVGPEGGFTDQEMTSAHAANVVPVHLGPRVLRAETAGVAALAMLAALAGDAR